MATLPTNVPGLSANLNGVVITGAEPVLEAIASAVDASYAHSGTNNASGTFTADFELANMPTDFGSMATLSVQLRYHQQTGTRVNTWNSLQATVVDSGGAALSNTVTIASNITTTTPTNSSVVTLTGLNTTADKATWDAAYLRVSWTITKSMGGDSLERRVTAAQLTGTYNIALAAYTLDTQPGTFSLSGQDATLLKTSAVNAEVGAFTLTGQDTTLTFTPGIQNYEIDAQPGAFTLTGQDATLLKDSGFNAEAGTFLLSWQAATLLKTSEVNAEAGAFTFTGQNAELLVDSPNKEIVANAGAFTITGQDAQFTVGVLPNISKRPIGFMAFGMAGHRV